MNDFQPIEIKSIMNPPAVGDKQDFFLTSGLCRDNRLGADEEEDDFPKQLLCFS